MALEIARKTSIVVFETVPDSGYGQAEIAVPTGSKIIQNVQNLVAATSLTVFEVPAGENVTVRAPQGVVAGVDCTVSYGGQSTGFIFGNQEADPMTSIDIKITGPIVYIVGSLVG